MNIYDSIRIRDDIPYLLNYLSLTGIGVEVGTQNGLYAQVLLGGSFLSKLVLVDCWDLFINKFQNDSDFTKEKLEGMESKVRERFKYHILNKRVEIKKGFSLDISNLFKDNSLDFVYLDADHREESVSKDLYAWYPKIKSKGIISGHDYINNKPWPPTYIKFGVIEAVSKFRVNLPDHDFFITEDDIIPSWIIVKP